MSAVEDTAEVRALQVCPHCSGEYRNLGPHIRAKHPDSPAEGVPVDTPVIRRVRVREGETGFYPEFDQVGNVVTTELNWVRRREGDVFDLIEYDVPITEMRKRPTRDGVMLIPVRVMKDGKPASRRLPVSEQFNGRWMEAVDEGTPLTKTGGQKSIEHRTAMLIASRQA